MQSQQAAEIVHILSGRIRLRAPGLAFHDAACRRVAEALMQSLQCDVVTVQPATGSVLVQSSSGSLDPEAVCARLRELVESECDEGGCPIVSSLAAESQPSATRIARAVAHAMGEVNQDVSAAMGHRVDLGTLVPIMFMGIGMLDIGFRRKMLGPPWYTLFWWSLRFFMTFNGGAARPPVKPPAPGPG